jgi:hypothetical protein
VLKGIKTIIPLLEMIQTMLLDLLKTNLISITMTEIMMLVDQEAQTTDQEDQFYIPLISIKEITEKMLKILASIEIHS